MAEAAAALGIAAAAVQFFDFSLKALSLCKQIRDSEKGATQANQELETYIGKLKQVHQNLKTDTRLQVANRPITRARQDCVAVVDELQKLLDDVKSKSADKNFAAAKATFRALKNKRAQKSFMSAVSVETKNDVAVLLDGQEKLSDSIQKILLPEIHKMHAASASSHTKTQDQLGKVATTSSASHDKTHGLLRDVQKSQESSLKAAKSTQVAISKGLSTIGARTNSIAVNVEAAARRKEVMDSLWYPEIFERQQSIKPPLFDSFEWIFDDSPACEDRIQAVEEWEQPQERFREELRGKFARWLRGDQPLFWISGKPGSGKSSLMSLIQSDARTDEALSVWAIGRRLYRFSFYFWRPGSPLQKTVHGFLRSLLYQLVEAKPAVIDSLPTTQSTRSTDWTTISLLAAFRKCLSAFHGDRIFLMIDGLDEYEDDYDDVLKFMSECQQGAFLKVCVSSRPETQILNRLSTYPFLRLQDLNYKDIELFIKGKLGPYEHCISREIRETLIARAEGVFLWVVLVVDDIKRGALAGDDSETLRRRLESIPPGLDELFEQLLEDINSEHLNTLKLCLFHLDGRLWSPFLREDHCSLSWITASMPKCEHIRTSADFIKLCIENSKALIAQGKGLLEFDPGMIEDGTSAWIFDTGKNEFIAVDEDTMESCQRQIRFVHRSAHDLMFHPERTSGVHDRLRLTEQDVNKLVEWTSRGCEMLIRFLPLSIRHSATYEGFFPRRSVYHPMSRAIRGITALCKNTKRDHNIHEWLDRIYDILPERFATQRETRLPPAASKKWSSKVDFWTSWHLEKDFWLVAAGLDGYLESRWNQLVQHHHSRAICSFLLGRLGEEHPSIDRCPKRLLAKTQPKSISRKHNRGTQVSNKLWTMSWNADTEMDEQYIMAHMLDLLIYSGQKASKKGQDSASVRDRSPFFAHCKASDLPLEIQIPLHSAWTYLPPPSASQSSGQDVTQIRLLSIAPRGEKKVSRIFYTNYEAYDDLVNGLCDIHVKPLEEVLDWDLDLDLFAQRPPRYRGTENQFSNCLEQVKTEIRADRKDQLSPSQQLDMLDLVEKHFHEWWTIVTPETLALCDISLEYAPKDWFEEPGLFGDLID